MCQRGERLLSAEFLTICLDGAAWVLPSILEVYSDTLSGHAGSTSQYSSHLSPFMRPSSLIGYKDINTSHQPIINLRGSNINTIDLSIKEASSEILYATVLPIKVYIKFTVEC